jgi:MoaA/NifB/PqqE/SkfB family radical SAM enzyme
MVMHVGEVVQELPSIVQDLYENHIVRHFKVLAPTVLHVNVNLRCNTKCAMCSIWELKSPHQLSLEQLDAIFTDPVYARVEYIILAGGEPTLRNDLADVVELMHKHMPRLKKLMIASNVLNRASVQAQYPRIARYCAHHKIRLTLGVSLDGVGETHDKVRGVPGAFEKVMENVKFMQQLQKDVPFNMSLDPTIFSMNVHELQKLDDLADRLKLPITFQFAAVADDYYHNSNLENVLNIDAKGRNSLIEFLRQRIAESSLFDALSYYYAEVIDRAQGATQRSLPCPFASQGLLLNPDGSLQYCHNSQQIGNALETSSSDIYYAKQNLNYRKSVRQNKCPSCQMSCLFFVSLRKEVFPYFVFIAKRSLKLHQWRWRKPKREAITEIQPSSAVKES